MKLSERLVRTRQQKGFTQEELAGATGLSVRTIQRIESGETIPRSFTVKTIAQALGESYEKLAVTEEEQSLPPAKPLADDLHFLKMLNLSCFSYLVVPFVHFLIPNHLLKKKQDLRNETIMAGRKLIRQQIIWTVSTHLLMLFTLAYNLGRVNFAGKRDHLVSYVWPFLLMYFINAIIIFINEVRIRQQAN